MSKHNFVESEPHGNAYQVIIYCTWCGVAVWDFNRNDSAMAILQKNAETPCKATHKAQS